MVVNFHDLRQTREWGYYLKQIGWRIVKVKSKKLKVKSYLYIRKLPLLPVAIGKLQRFQGKADFERLKQVCKKNKVVVVYVEPNLLNYESGIKKHENSLKAQGFRKSGHSFLPKKTLWLDLRKSSKQLLAQMKPKTRYNIGLSRRRGVKVEVISGQRLNRSPLLRGQILALLQENARRLKIFKIPKKWFEAQVKAFGNKCFAVLGYYENKLVAGNFFMVSSNACFYSHNGSTKVGRKLMAPSLCTWRGVAEAKRRNLKVFDFDGIDDGSFSLRKWKGFSRFKQGFGGRKVEFMGQFFQILPVNLF